MRPSAEIEADLTEVLRSFEPPTRRREEAAQNMQLGKPCFGDPPPTKEADRVAFHKAFEEIAALKERRAELHAELFASYRAEAAAPT